MDHSRIEVKAIEAQCSPRELIAINYSSFAEFTMILRMWHGYTAPGAKDVQLRRWMRLPKPLSILFWAGPRENTFPFFVQVLAFLNFIAQSSYSRRV